MLHGAAITTVGIAFLGTNVDLAQSSAVAALLTQGSLHLCTVTVPCAICKHLHAQLG